MAPQPAFLIILKDLLSRSLNWKPKVIILNVSLPLTSHIQSVMKAYDFSFLYISVCYPFSILAATTALVVQISSDLRYLSHSFFAFACSTRTERSLRRSLWVLCTVTWVSMITKSLRGKFGESNLTAEFRGLIAAGLGDGIKDGFSKAAQVEV